MILSAGDLNELASQSSEDGSATSGKRTLSGNAVDTAVFDGALTARPTSPWKSTTGRQSQYTFSDKSELNCDEDSNFEVSPSLSTSINNKKTPDETAAKSCIRRRSEPVNRCTAPIDENLLVRRQPQRPFSLPGRRVSAMESKKFSDALFVAEEEDDFKNEDEKKSSFDRNERKGRRHTIAEVQRGIKNIGFVQSEGIIGNTRQSESVPKDQIDCSVQKDSENRNVNHDYEHANIRAARQRILSRLSRTCEPESVATLTDDARVEPLLVKSKRRQPRKLESLISDNISAVADDAVNLPSLPESASNISDFWSTSFSEATSVVFRQHQTSRVHARLPCRRRTVEMTDS